jgi:YD repeat-containing protein
MAINPNISLAVRGVELQDPLAQYGKFAAIQNAQQQNQLAQMQMQEYERSRAEEEGARNYLAKADLSKPETRTELMRLYGKTGMALNTALGAQEQAALTQQETRGKIAETQTKTQAAQFDLQNKKLNYVLQIVGNSSNPQNAIEQINKGVKEGYISMAQGTAKIQKLQNMQPTEFAEFRHQNLMETLGALDQLNQSKQTTQDTDLGSFIQRQTYDAQGRPVGAPVRLPKTPSFSDVTAQGNLALAQSQEDWKRKNPGYDIKETEAGLVGVNKDNPRDVVPIMLDGTSVGAKAPPAKLVEVDTQLSSLAGSLKAFKKEVAKNKLTGARGLFTGEDTANMTSKYTSLLMGVKDLYTLGALTGPDMGIIENQLQNPASWAGSMTSKAAFNAQIKTIEDMLRRNHINTETAFGRPLKATTAALKDLGDTSAGAVDNDPLELRKPK